MVRQMSAVCGKQDKEEDDNRNASLFNLEKYMGQRKESNQPLPVFRWVDLEESVHRISTHAALVLAIACKMPVLVRKFIPNGSTSGTLWVRARSWFQPEAVPIGSRSMILF